MAIGKPSTQGTSRISLRTIGGSGTSRRRTSRKRNRFSHNSSEKAISPRTSRREFETESQRSSARFNRSLRGAIGRNGRRSVQRNRGSERSKKSCASIGLHADSHWVTAHPVRLRQRGEIQRCRDRPHWDVSDNWTACFIPHATPPTPNTRPPVTAPIIPTTMKKMLNGSGKRLDTETANRPRNIAPTPERAIRGRLNFSAMRPQSPRCHHSRRNHAGPVDSLPNCNGYVRRSLKTRGARGPRADGQVDWVHAVRSEASIRRTSPDDRPAGASRALDEGAILELFDRLFDLLAVGHHDGNPPRHSFLQGSLRHE